MLTRIAIVVLVLGSGGILAAKLLPAWERSKIETLKGEKSDLERKNKVDQESLDEEVKKLRDSGDAAAADKREEEGRREIDEAAKKGAERTKEIDREVEDRETRLMTGAMRPLWMRLGGAAAVLLALLVLVFAGSDVERAVAIFSAAVVLPAVF